MNAGRTRLGRTSIPISGKLDDRDNVRENPFKPEELPEELQHILMERRPKVEKGKAPRTPLQMLEGRHVLSILLYVDAMSPVLKTDIYSNISRSAAMADKIEDLRVLGLVDIYWTVRSNTNVVVITEEGRRVASMVKRMIDIIDGTEEQS